MKKIILWVFLLVPIIIWVLMMSLSDRFGSLTVLVKSLGQISGLVGMSLLSLVIVLSSRLPIVEKYLASLDKAYKNHHLFGGISLILLLAHPIFLALSYLSSSLYLAAIFLIPNLSRIDIFIGEISLFIMMGLLVITFFRFLKYPLWKLTHKFLNLAFFFAVIHTLIVTSDISNNLILKTYYLILIIIVGMALIYKNLLIKKYPYKLVKLNKLNSEITELLLEPIKSKLLYSSGQFVFLEIKDSLFSNEAHPFSIASSPNENLLRLIIKNLGDYTSQINLLKEGVTINLEGPYGHFSNKFYNDNEFVWIAGGIGITPFIGMAADLKEGQKADLYYSFSKKEEEIFGNYFIQISKQNPAFRYCSHLTEEKGRLTVEHILNKSGSLNNKTILLCGPKPMMESLKKQLEDKGVPSGKIINEDFGF
jgi:predicted ferric reductase